MNDAAAAKPLDPLAVSAASIAPAQLDGEAEAAAWPAFPTDLPPWQRDVVAISARVRALLATLRPIVVRVRGFWDHVVRRVALGGGRALEVDCSGSYRVR